MGCCKSLTVVVMAVVVMAVVVMAVETSAKVPDCASKLVPCTSYLNSTKPPPESCCQALRETIQNQLDCLCKLCNNPTLLQHLLGFNITQALQLPNYCGFTSYVNPCTIGHYRKRTLQRIHSRLYLASPPPIPRLSPSPSIAQVSDFAPVTAPTTPVTPPGHYRKRALLKIHSHSYLASPPPVPRPSTPLVSDVPPVVAPTTPVTPPDSPPAIVATTPVTPPDFTPVAAPATPVTPSTFSIGAIVGGVVGVVALFLVGFALWRRWTQQGNFFDVPAEEYPEVNLDQLKRFSLQELQFATDSFSNKNIVGRGGFGKVYKGRLVDGSLVAVKRLKEKRTPLVELQFQTEVEMISMAVHRNLLRLRGFCITPTERLLVYPYMANGSVASCLRERQPLEPPLDWPTRRCIALGSARGLSYMHDHCNPKIVHRDVKAANILLDEDYEAIVGDFGLAKLMDYKDTHVTTGVRGTAGHIAPEYLSSGKSSEKTDVFGYGILLLELITGQRAYDLARLANDDDVMLLDWVKGLLKENKLEMMVDPDLKNNYVEAEVEQLIQVALLCTQSSPTDRPKMSEVLKMLEGEGLAEKWEEWEKLEVVRQKVDLEPQWTSEWVVDSTQNLHPTELSGPR